MIVIEQVLVDSALAIKAEYNSLKSHLVKYEKEAADLGVFLLKMCKELEDYAHKDIHKASSVNESTKHILDKMVLMEQESDRISNLVEHINTSLEKLRKDDWQLYEKIKKRNPDASDDQIVHALNEKMLKSDT